MTSAKVVEVEGWPNESGDTEKCSVKKLNCKGKPCIAVNTGEISVWVCVCVFNMGSTLIVYMQRRMSHRGKI